MRKKIISDNRGFTIVEVIAAVFVFSVIVVAVGGIFVRSLQIERRNLAAQKVQENTLRAFEMMAREIRVSRITVEDSSCLAQSISFVRPDIGTVDYTLSAGQIMRNENSAGATAVTSSDVNFSKLIFCISGTTASDQKPVRVTILAEVNSIGSIEAYQYNIQTTITSRDLSNDFQN
jgi:prepilin-type N-terminal cleavage/methylation domain-containing protein